MFERISNMIRHRMVGLIVRYLSKKSRLDTLSLRNCWDNVNRCIVCWPESGIDITCAELILKRLRERFPEAAISVLSLPGIGASPSDIGIKVVEIKAEHFNIMGFPKSNLKLLLKSLKADVAVDLSQEYNPVSAYCCALSGARIKIGFKLTGGELVYNFQIAPRSERKGIERYRVLASYIG